MPKIKNKWLKLFNLSSLLMGIILSACTTNNSNTSSNNEWSLPSQKPGLIHAPNNLLTQANQKLVVGNYFKLTWKKAAEKMNPWTLAGELNQSLNNKNNQPFDGQETITNDFNTFNKAALLDKYFTNRNNFFPTWFVYDIRASVVNAKINLLITMVDTNQLPTTPAYQSKQTFSFASTYQTPAVSELINSTTISVNNPEELLASNVQTANLKVLNQTELTNNRITASYSDLKSNDKTGTLTFKLTLTDSTGKSAEATKTLSGFINFNATEMLAVLKRQNIISAPNRSNTNSTTIKNRIDKYNSVMEKKSDTNYTKIINSPVLAWAYAVEAASTGANETTAKNKIEGIADLTENASNSKLASLSAYIVNLTGLVYTLFRSTNLPSGIQKSDLEKVVQAVIKDYLENYYYGVKNGSEQQKIYKNSAVYEYQAPLVLATIFYWKADLFDQATYTKLNEVINYFLPDVSKVGVNDSRYVMDSAPTSKTVDSFNQILNQLFIKLVSGALIDQAKQVNLAIEQFSDWMKNIDVNPTEASNAFHENKSSSDSTQNWVLFLNRMDFLRKLHPSFVASKLFISYANIYTKLITYAKDTLFKTVITSSSVDDDTNLKLVGIFNITSRNARLANQLEPVLKALFIGKSEASLTKFSTLNWGFIKPEIQRLLPSVKT